MQYKFHKGFTLTELLVTITIFAFMTAFLAVKYGGFSRQIIVTNFAYDVALAFRQTQSLAINVSDVSASGPDGNFQAPYGLHFSMSTPDQFILFRDTMQTGGVVGIYDEGQDQIIRIYSIRNGIVLNDICYVTSCSERPTGNRISVVYVRPDPSPLINGTRARNQVLLHFRAGDGTIKRVQILATGQISVID